MLLALLLILAGLAGAIAPQTAAAKVYTINVGGVQITSENAANITGPNITGKVSFDESTHTLILNNATIDGGLESAIAYKSVGEDRKIVPADGITIRLQGNNTLKSGLEPTISALASIRITGGGSLTIKSGNSAIKVGYADVKEANLTIDGCTLTANRRVDVMGSLQINNSNVTVSDQNSGYTLRALNGIALSGCQIVSPYGARIKSVKGFGGESYTVVTDLGDLCEKVIIETGNGPKPEPEPEKPKLTLEPKELDVDADGGKKEVTLSCNVPYHIDDLNKPDWLSVSGNSPESKAIQKMTITVEPNTGGKREGMITFKTSEGDVTLKVTQAAAGTKPEPEKAVFTLEPKELKVDADGGKKEVTLSCDKFYYVSSTDKPDWLSVSGYSTGYTKSQTLTIIAKPNTGGKREGVITFKTFEGDVTLKVTQEGKKEKPTLTLSISFKGDGSAIPAGGGTKEVTVTSNGQWSASLPKDCKWLTLDKDGGTNDGTLTLTAKENTAYEPRKVTLTVSLDEGDKSQTLEITQAANPKPVLELEQENVVTGPLGSAREVKIRSNVAWKATPTVAWLHVKPSEGTGSKSATLTITADENTAEKGRTGTITIESTDGSKLTRMLTVAQKPAAVAATGISLNPASITMGSGGGMVGFNVYASKGWTISGSPDWMHPDATRGSGTRLVIVRFDRNESGAERTGKLTVKSDDGKAERTFTLTQRASQRKPTRPSDDGTYDYDLAIGAEEITVGPSEGAGSSISVATSRLWAGSTTEDWIRLESAVGRGNGSFTFSLAANPSKEMRHGTITVRTEHGMDELKVAIHQQGRVGDEEAPTRVKVSSVSLDPSSLTVNGDLSTTLISAIVSPENARNKGLLWMSSNAAVATVKVTGTPAVAVALSDRPQLRFAAAADDYALVTIVGKGKATITAATSDGSSIVARCEVNVLSTVANTVPYAPQAKVYTVGPTLYLSLPTAETVQVYTLAGTLYRTWQAPAGDTSQTLPAGTYIIKVGQLTEKVVVR